MFLRMAFASLWDMRYLDCSNLKQRFNLPVVKRVDLFLISSMKRIYIVFPNQEKKYYFKAEFLCTEAQFKAALISFTESLVFLQYQSVQSSHTGTKASSVAMQ